MNRVKFIEQHYTIEEVADKIRVHKNTVRKFIRNGSLAPVKRISPTIVRIPASAVQRLLNNGGM